RSPVRIVVRLIDVRVLAERAAEKRQLGTDGDMRPCDARNGQTHRLDAPEVLPGEVEVEQDLGQHEVAGPVPPEGLQRLAVDNRERDRLLDLVLPLVALQIANLPPLEVLDQLLARQQALVQAVLVAELDICVLDAELELQ